MNYLLSQASLYALGTKLAAVQLGRVVDEGELLKEPEDDSENNDKKGGKKSNNKKTDKRDKSHNGLENIEKRDIDVELYGLIHEGHTSDALTLLERDFERHPRFLEFLAKISLESFHKNQEPSSAIMNWLSKVPELPLPGREAPPLSLKTRLENIAPERLRHSANLVPTTTTDPSSLSPTGASNDPSRPKTSTSVNNNIIPSLGNLNNLNQSNSAQHTTGRDNNPSGAGDEQDTVETVSAKKSGKNGGKSRPNTSKTEPIDESKLTPAAPSYSLHQDNAMWLSQVDILKGQLVEKELLQPSIPTPGQPVVFPAHRLQAFQNCGLGYEWQESVYEELYPSTLTLDDSRPQAEKTIYNRIHLNDVQPSLGLNLPNGPNGPGPASPKSKKKGGKKDKKGSKKGGQNKGNNSSPQKLAGNNNSNVEKPSVDYAELAVLQREVYI